MASELCYLCNEIPSLAYKFKVIKDKQIINKSFIDNSISHCHRMCPECLIRYIFIKQITLLEKPAKEYKFICPCSKGSISLSYEQLIDLFQNKTISNFKNKKEKQCKHHSKIYSKFCKDCKVDVCDECIYESIEEHYEHRIEDKKILYDKLKNFFSTINLKNNSFDKFMETFNNICKQFREILEKNYNEILISLDQIINSLIDFRAKYSVYYKEKVINSVQTLKILKMFYSNYYYDIHKAEKGNDFRIYKYLNQINYELDEVNLINNKTNANEKLELLKECSDYLNENINNILDITFCFRKVNNGFRKYQSIQRCDEKNLKRILKVNEHKIITCGEGYYMNCLEDNNGEFSAMSKIPVKDKITAILLFKEGNILTSFGKHSHYNIQEWIINENFSNIKDNNTDAISLNKSFNDSDSYDNLSLNKSMTAYDLSLTKNNTMTQNLLNNSLYERATSFLSNHKDDINVMVEMSNLMFASAGNDKRIFIWEKDKQSKKYKLFQEITKELKNMSLKNPILNMIYLYDKRLVSNDSSAIYIWYINPSKLNNPTGFYSIQQKINSTNGNITSLYQIREGYLIFGTKNSNLEIWKEVEGKYQLMQNMSLKIGEISSINQIKDNRVIVASSKGLMKIIELKTNSETKKVEYQLSEFIKSIQGLPINCIECFEDGSFVLGQKTTLHVWKNNESI